jgi:hypothetical protein
MIKPKQNILETCGILIATMMLQLTVLFEKLIQNGFGRKILIVLMVGWK